MNKEQFKQSGGKWLGTARTWVQWNCKNGDRVTWGSNDILNPPLTIKKVEDLAGDVAFTAHQETKLNQNNTLQQIKSEVSELKEQLEWYRDNDDIPSCFLNYVCRIEKLIGKE